MSWKHHLDKVGVVGSFIAAACCLGLPAVLSIIAAIGLGFIINDAVLLPLMIVFLVIALIGLFFGYRIHRRPWPLALATVSAFAAYFFIFVRTVSPAAYLAIAGLVVASVLNIMLRRKCAPACKSS
jgi:mercuric ion transport protein